MSSYYPSFNYRGLNSFTDKNLIVVAFDADQGEMDTFLGVESIYTNKFDGSRRLDYGAKFNNVALIKISVIKANRSDFTVAEVRDFLKWTTGTFETSYLDLVIDGNVKCSFLGRAVNVYQQKLDARTIGFTIEFESVSPWGYSPIQTISCSFGQALSVNDSGVLSKGTDDALLGTTSDGVLYNGTEGGSGVFQVTNDGVVFIDNSVYMNIDNKSDDLCSFVILNTVLTNVNSNYISIYNETLNEETIITNMVENERVTLSSGQFIVSDKPNKMFGNDFNYIWPRLAPGINTIIVSGTGVGYIEFTYRYPIKLGDCAINIGFFDDECGCGDNTNYGFINWDDIIDTPDTLAEYGIKDAYTISEIDKKLENVGGECNASVDADDLNDMLTDVLGQQ